MIQDLWLEHDGISPTGFSKRHLSENA